MNTIHLIVSITWIVVLQHHCTALRVDYVRKCRSPVWSNQFRSAEFLNYKPFSSSHSLHASSRNAYEKLVYSPPKYIINTIKNQPERQRWEPANVIQLTGTETRQVERDLLALAILTGAKMEVDQSGNILYTFPRQLDRILMQRSIRHRVDTAMAKILPALAHIYRASFGLMLISSIAVVYLALIVALASIAASGGSGSGSGRGRGRGSGRGSSQGKSRRRSSDDEDDDDSSQHHRRMGYRPRTNFVFTFDFFDTLRLFYRPTIHYQHVNLHSHQQRCLPFLAAVHSFLFGDGDPNEKHDKDRLYPAAVQYIQRHRGYVTAEELALFLPKVPSSSSGNDDVVVSESYVLPFLLRYGGKPILVDDVIVYHFPDLVTMNDMSPSKPSQAASSLMKVPSPSDRADEVVAEHELEPLLEVLPEFSRSTWSQRIRTVMLACVNYVGVLALKSILRDHRSLRALPSDFWRTIRWVLPLFDAYATAFLLTPAVRWLFHLRNVRIIQERNRLRRQW